MSDTENLIVCVRKADLRELKRLHVQENRLMQAHASKALAAKEEQIKKFELDKQVNIHTHFVCMKLVKINRKTSTSTASVASGMVT